MKIVAGLGCIDDYVSYVEAGADEFFCGYVPYEWTKQYGIMLPLNRREVQYYNVQIGSLEELRILKRMVDKYKVPVKITLNSLFYMKEQYELLKKIIQDCISVGFDTFIIADLALLAFLREEHINCKIHLSGEIGEVNHLMMDFMNQFRIDRFIFHRKNSIADMKSIIANNKVQNLEYEAFVLNEWCHFTGGFCNSLHCDELVHLCKVPYQMGRVNEHDTRSDDMFHQCNCGTNNECDTELEDKVGASGCGLCALRKLKEAGITHLKLVGRGNHSDSMIRDITSLKNALDILEKEGGAHYIQKMKQELFPDGCNDNCYYREPLGE